MIGLPKPNTALEYKAVAIRQRSSQRGEFFVTKLDGLSRTRKPRYEAAVLPDFSKRLMGVVFTRSCNATLLLLLKVTPSYSRYHF